VRADHVPHGSRLVLAGRTDVPLRMTRLRAEGRILEIGPRDLALTPEEAAALLRAAEVSLSVDELATLYERTEGWPVGLYLAALYLREGGPLGRRWSPSVVMTAWSASTWSRSSWPGSPGGIGCS
jgi:LuxR family transcriptional regulator, maltose regulon positive regulatory protein